MAEIVTVTTVRCKPNVSKREPLAYEIFIMGSWIATNRAFVDWWLQEFKTQKRGIYATNQNR